MKFILKAIAFINCAINSFVKQEFMLEGYSFLFSMPFIPISIYCKGFKVVFNYRGKEFMSKRDDYMIKRCGMTWEEAHKPENAHLFVATDYVYKTS
jgi:hypothetical protein